MPPLLVAIIKIVLLEASCALLIINRLTGDKHLPFKRSVFIALATLSTFAFTNFGDLHGNGKFVHYWEQFHFYMGAKYQQEVGWFDLYKAVFLADREGTHAVDHVTQTRDLTNFEVIPVSQALQDGPSVRAKFTDARWDEFKADWAVMSRSPTNWPNVLKDHGNSNSPAWAILAHPIATLLPLRQSSQVLIGLLDCALLVFLWWFVFRTFSIEEAGIGLVIFSCVPGVFNYLAGSFLRFDWIFAVGMSMCFLKREKYATAGAFLGFAVATKIFPLFFGVALLMRALWDFWKTRRFAPRYLRFAAGATASLATAMIIASVMFGSPRVWLEYKKRIDVTRDEKFYGSQYSLRTVFLQFVESTPYELWNRWAAPGEIKQGRADVEISNYRISFLALQLLFTLLIALALIRADDVSAFAMGPLLVFTWLIVNMYYWNMLGLLALGLARRKEPNAFYALLGLHLMLGLHYFYQQTRFANAQGYFFALLLVMGIVAYALAEGRTLIRARAL